MFHLLRHADHGHVGKVLTGRAAGAHLTQRGHDQAAAVARRMAETRLDALLSSPQPRARETAEHVAAATATDIQMSDDLDEIDFGHWAGQTFEALEQDSQWRRWNAERDKSRTPAGDTMSAVAARLTGLVDRLREAFPGGTVCLVSHCDVIRAALCHYLGKPFQAVHDFEIAPASVTTLLIGSRGATVLAFNQREPVKREEMAR